MRLSNTLSGQLEEIPKPLSGHPLRLFVCGPTVYDYLHIGNARPEIVFDVLVRYLRSRGIKVTYLKNITDIDDKIIARASEAGITPAELAKKYTIVFKRNMRALGITSVTKYPRATKFIPEIKAQVKKLIDKGHAYKIDGDGWYFDLTTFPDYGKLARRTIEQAEDGVSRIDASDEKRNRGDFCLWKFSKPGEPTWKAPFGAGRPGWHIEDTAISEKFFGSQYDIHGGGRDLIFPHHEAEIAQEESISGKKPFVKLWMHVGFLTVDGRKMGKSIGNVITIEQMLARHSAAAFRYFILSANYRNPINYTEEALTGFEKGIQNFIRTLDSLGKIRSNSKSSTIDLASFERDFTDAMDQDLNTAEALSVLNRFASAVSGDASLSKSDAKAAKAWLKEKLEILGINLKKDKKQAEIPIEVQTLVKKRELFRTNKQFTDSDALRDQIDALGYTIEDSPEGPKILPK